MLRIEGVEKAYGRPIVRGVDLTVEPGRILGLLGPNGAGKTTTFRMAVGLIRPDAGSITLRGLDVTSWPLARRARAGLGYLPQECSVFRDLSARANLQVVLERLGLERRERRRRCGALLEEYGLTPVGRQPARTLSGGQKRRLEIARALAAEPRVILFDEPFAGVDPLAVRELRRLILDLRERGLAILITDHDAREILDTADQVSLIHEGQIVTQGTPPELVADELARRVYLGEGFAQTALPGWDGITAHARVE